MSWLRDERLNIDTLHPESVFSDGTGEYCLSVTQCYGHLIEHVSFAIVPLYLQLQREKELVVTTFAGASRGTAA